MDCNPAYNIAVLIINGARIVVIQENANLNQQKPGVPFEMTLLNPSLDSIPDRPPLCDYDICPNVTGKDMFAFGYAMTFIFLIIFFDYWVRRR